MKTTGIELIAIERQEQIEKHGYTVDLDSKYNSFELSDVANCILTGRLEYWPITWDMRIFNHIISKPLIERLSICGALIAAEIDRLQNL
jgi:hypothetical protein